MAGIAEGMWAGRRAFVLGGGPSVRTLDLSKLRKEAVVGLNMGFLLDPTVNLICDLRLVQQLTVDPRWEAYGGVKLWLNSEQPNDPWRPPGVATLHEAVASGRAFWSRSLQQGLFRGMSAGVSGLNLADLLGADPIYLIGFDLKGSHGKTVNWHNEYATDWSEAEAVYRRHIADFEAVAASHAIRAKVVNLNPASALRCFPTEWPGNVVEGLGSKGPRSSVAPRLEPTVAIRAMEGFGDNIYTRAAVRAYTRRNGPVYVHTPWPQLFWDLPDVRVARRETYLRTQLENISRVGPAIWNTPPPGLHELGCAYSPHDTMSALEAMTRWLGVSGDGLDFSLPVKPEWNEPWMDDLPQPIGIVHPPSVRMEWMNTARNPRPEYIQAVIDATPEVHWISVGWNAPGAEWYEGGIPRGVARRFDAGELGVGPMLALMSRAAVALCGPCFLLPAAAALGVPVFVIFGGSYAPEFLIDPRMGKRVGYVAPSPFCACLQHDHACNKEIEPERVVETFRRFRERPEVRERVRGVREITLNVCQGVGDIFWAYQKFAPHVDRIHLNVVLLPGQEGDAVGNRALGFLALLPKIGRLGTVVRSPDSYERLAHSRCSMWEIMAGLAQGETEFDYACNAPLEEGTRIEDVDPEYAIEETVPLRAAHAAVPFDRFFTVYVSGQTLRMAECWPVARWARAVWLLSERLGPETPIVLLGAGYDEPVLRQLSAMLDQSDRPHALLVDRPPAEVVDILRRSAFFMGYQSGLGVLADNLDVPQLMLYYAHLEKLRYAWCKRANRDNGIFRAALFTDSPEEAVGGIPATALQAH